MSLGRGLVALVLAEGDVAPGIAALERALELGAWAAEPNLELARLSAAGPSSRRAVARGAG